MPNVVPPDVTERADTSNRPAVTDDSVNAKARKDADPSPVALDPWYNDLSATGSSAEASEKSIAGAGTLHAAALAASMTTVSLFFAAYGWRLYTRFGVTGFDTGIFAQGTWKLAHFQDPFVTIRGLHIFGEHSSYILALVAPLYLLWPDPRTLITLQALALVVPAYPIYRIGVDRIGHAPALVFAISYLTLPAVWGTASWLFHPDCFAAAFLSLALLAIHQRRDGLLALWVVLALLCKEDVSFIVAMLGVLMIWIGRRQPGIKLILAATVSFIVSTFIVMPLLNGQGNIFFERNYGVQVEGPASLLSAVPHVLSAAIGRAGTDEGLAFIMVMLAPLLFLALLEPRWLLPVLPPLILNLASNVNYQYDNTFWYSLTSMPTIFMASILGFARLRRRNVIKNSWAVLAAMVLVTSIISVGQSPAKQMWMTLHAPADEMRSVRAKALALVPAEVPVSASYNFDAYLLNRPEIYEFPNPWKPANWGFNDGTPHGEKTIARIRFLIVDKATLSPEDLMLFEEVSQDSSWTVLLQERDIVVLERR